MCTQGNVHFTSVAPLFVPADRPERFEKADRSGADTVIIDLEDAVAPAAKDGARSNLHHALTLRNPTYVRVNGQDSSWYAADLAALRTLGLRRICLPKAQSAATLDAVVRVLGGDIEIIALIETARGLEAAGALAAHSHVARLAFGPADFALDLGVPASHDLKAHAMMRLAVASRAAGKPLPLDGPSFEVTDTARLATECRQALDHGAGGKLCIHPAQTSHVSSAFQPSDEQLRWAQRVVDAARDGAARLVDGRMIDAPIVAQAWALLARDRSQFSKGV
ncbi:CoA ester lyase [Mesorhizobium sp. M7A.F.Ca.US.006.04.2.1]|uniref:HpcH/HpaI aldolase/citrate lyase family protein n=1 Tax=unclassified Mesorhizobium TaxID=325217 RepID=UPI000FD5B04B|nr:MULTISPECIES: CoA ester lyase [unclassified Mesorhizobium]MBZ9887355.1 CoA ester lyase [Mesorhizobium sp. BR1-1-3]RVA88860.1 CoA ester lyase [Mesorhizobium sp. M7A.F.Ca.US.006.04.2.1]